MIYSIEFTKCLNNQDVYLRYRQEFSLCDRNDKSDKINWIVSTQMQIYMTSQSLQPLLTLWLNQKICTFRKTSQTKNINSTYRRPTLPQLNSQEKEGEEEEEEESGIVWLSSCQAAVAGDIASSPGITNTPRTRAKIASPHHPAEEVWESVRSQLNSSNIAPSPSSPQLDTFSLRLWVEGVGCESASSDKQSSTKS